MKVLFAEWDSYGKKDIQKALREEGHILSLFPFEVSSKIPYGRYIEDKAVEERLLAALHREVPDVVFSVDYFPVLSRVCQKEKIRYLSWNYDCPHRLLYSPTVNAPCNMVYLFDRTICQEFHDAGVSTVHYMPLAADTKRLDEMGEDRRSSFSYQYDVSFVGSFYLEKGGNDLDRIESALPERARGYLRALCAVQLKLQGYDLIEEMLAPILEDMYQICPMSSEPFFKESRAHIYGEMVRKRLTAIERIDLLEAIAREYRVDVFTHIADFPIRNVRGHGSVQYDTEMPMVFKQSKIDLNITSRGIRSGIPLRAFDIMGAGGFLLTNFQADLLEHFVPGEDLVYYESKEDLLDKIGYYLVHEEERRAIARNGHDKVAAEHTYRHRVREMFAAL